MENIIIAISSVGFPIVACLLLGAYVYKVEEKQRETTDELKRAVDNLKNAIDNNTMIIKMLYEKIIGDDLK